MTCCFAQDRTFYDSLLKLVAHFANGPSELAGLDYGSHAAAS
jgi:hypothetical protein